MRKYLSTLLVASMLITSCSKDAEVIREKIISQSRPILSGQGQPDNGKGEDGDYYLDLTNAKLYGPKTQGAWGEPSLDLKGLPGTNGITPTISEDGYWVINGVKTTTKAQGERGQNGRTPVFSIIDGYWAIDGVKTSTKAQGDKGQDGHTPVLTIIDGYWAIDGVKTSTKAQGDKGQNGHTPVFSVIDGYWAIDGVKTSTKAQGDKGQDGHTPIFSVIDGYWAIDGVKTSTKAQGERGQNGHTPVFSVIDGYWAIDGVKTTTKAQGEQGTPGQNGADGSKILAEDRAPQATDGVKGDYFIDKAAKIFYGPKTETGWPTTGISLVPGNTIATADYELSPDGKTLEKWLNKQTRVIDMNADPKLKNVTKIANNAFQKEDNGEPYQLTTIIVGDRVTEIGNSAFRHCARLRTVDLPEGITRIENGTFDGCVRLQTIEIPEAVTSIGVGAFSSCMKLYTMILPERVNSLGNAAFSNCASLHSVIIRNKTAFAINNSVFTQTPIQNIYVFSEKVDDYKNVVAVPYKDKVKALDFPGDN